MYTYIYIHNSIYIYIYVCVHHMGLCENVVPQYMAISIATIMINYNQTCINPIFMFIVDSIYIYQYDMHMSKIICISITDVHPKYHANPWNLQDEAACRDVALVAQKAIYLTFGHHLVTINDHYELIPISNSISI